jgi:hypothetical protein
LLPNPLRGHSSGFALAVYSIRVQQLPQQEAKFPDAVERMPAVAFITLQNGERIRAPKIIG